MIGGDFNCYENALDKFGGNISVGGECKSLKCDFVLIDAWRKLHPSAREFTWFNHDYSIASCLEKFSGSLFQRSCLHLIASVKSHLVRFLITILFLLFLISLMPLSAAQGCGN